MTSIVLEGLNFAVHVQFDDRNRAKMAIPWMITSPLLPETVLSRAYSCTDACDAASPAATGVTQSQDIECTPKEVDGEQEALDMQESLRSKRVRTGCSLPSPTIPLRCQPEAAAMAWAFSGLTLDTNELDVASRSCCSPPASASSCESSLQATDGRIPSLNGSVASFGSSCDFEEGQVYDFSRLGVLRIGGDVNLA